MDLVLRQIAAVEAGRDALVRPERRCRGARGPADQAEGHRARVRGRALAGGLTRRFANRRQLAAYAGLAPSPWQSGRVDREQGIAKSGNPRLRPPWSSWPGALAAPPAGLGAEPLVPRARGPERGRPPDQIVAPARKLLAALWRYTTLGELPVGATLKTV